MQQIKKLFFLFNILVSFSVWSQTITEIKGYAPAYVGQKIEIFEIEDYFSLREKLVATSTVGTDSTFKFSFYNDRIQKVIIRSNKNKGFLYIQPKAKYEVFVPLKNSYDAYRPLGNDVEISFFNLDSLDINYKILAFERWVNNFLGTYYITKKINPVEFNKELTDFKSNVDTYYSKDTNLFLRTYVKYSIATLDDMQLSGSVNRFDKFNMYVNSQPVVYDCEPYMSYISSLYSNLIPRLPVEVNNRVYMGLLKNSPTLILNALANEYTLMPTTINTPNGPMKTGNLRLRELVMIKSLSDVYYSPDFPKTNILNVLDSLSKHSIFKENKAIARNLVYRLTELVPGGKAPDFLLTSKNNEVKTKSSYSKKYLYIHFLDPNNKESIKELELLKKIYSKYQGDVQFISVYEKRENVLKKHKEEIASLPWETFELEADDQFFKSFQIVNLPFYVLIDPYGYIISAPALGPKPNGEYLSIDKVFFDIKKAKARESEPEKK